MQERQTSASSAFFAFINRNNRANEAYRLHYLVSETLETIGVARVLEKYCITTVTTFPRNQVISTVSALQESDIHDSYTKLSVN